MLYKQISTHYLTKLCSSPDQCKLARIDPFLEEQQKHTNMTNLMLNSSQTISLLKHFPVNDTPSQSYNKKYKVYKVE